jgi:hypothetical protein
MKDELEDQRIKKLSSELKRINGSSLSDYDSLGSQNSDVMSEESQLRESCSKMPPVSFPSKFISEGEPPKLIKLLDSARCHEEGEEISSS